MAVQLSLSCLSGMSGDDRQAVTTLVDASIAKAEAQGRPAVAALFGTLRQVLGVSEPSSPLALESAADLDTDELEAIVHGLDTRADRERGEGHPSRAAFFAELCASLQDEQHRRATLLASLDRAMAEYDAHLPGWPARRD